MLSTTFSGRSLVAFGALALLAVPAQAAKYETDDTFNNCDVILPGEGTVSLAIYIDSAKGTARVNLNNYDLVLALDKKPAQIFMDMGSKKTATPDRGVYSVGSFSRVVQAEFTSPASLGKLMKALSSAKAIWFSFDGEMVKFTDGLEDGRAYNFLKTCTEKKGTPLV